MLWLEERSLCSQPHPGMREDIRDVPKAPPATSLAKKSILGQFAQQLQPDVPIQVFSGEAEGCQLPSRP